ncbi:hypothetical protein P170DRAFT_475417 [Aspergillus steynii IBT 23096]|uniref:Uncharacterized protein n=1 Tax=Aspergillus steynii IBT 23096 TaxID=1392250 RepID=A0A2I2G881_9EURO|nr:uncharacterized protein P170DRAFT_475417 [Aspergillus steynii IBT 23096]PLB49100.1 hypothetical protein P170DRAFT_475417 [Aspergillus steynii IBT 23096]
MEELKQQLVSRTSVFTNKIGNANFKTPSLRTWAVLISSGITLSSTVALYTLHRYLGKRLEHEQNVGDVSPFLPFKITSVPPVWDNWHYLLNCATCRVHRKDLPPRDLPGLFELMVRQNMMEFRRLPYGYFVYWIAPRSVKPTFADSHILALDFVERDALNGIFVVCQREADKLVCLVNGRHPIETRLIMHYWEEGDDVIFCRETLMWRLKARENEKQRKLPLENPVLRFMHELTAWWLLDSGVRYLKEMKPDREKKHRGFHVLRPLFSLFRWTRPGG